MQLVTSTIFRIHHTHHTANDGMIRNDHKKIKVHTVTCSHGFHSNIPTHKYIPVAHLMSNCGYPKIATSKLNEIPTHSHIVWKLQLSPPDGSLRKLGKTRANLVFVQAVGTHWDPTLQCCISTGLNTRGCLFLNITLASIRRGTLVNHRTTYLPAKKTDWTNVVKPLSQGEIQVMDDI